ncbi:MAG: hypothetical protein GTN69_10520 [Armatimonadetes bacterium]|nr:hypothetical protein [Armatimonadota bacterium]
MRSDVDPEKAVIGAVMLQPSCFYKVQLQPNDFKTPNAARTWSAMLSLVDQGKPIDPVAVEVETNGRVPVDWLLDALGGVPTSENVGYYADLVADDALKRRVLRVAGDMLKRESKELSGQELLRQAQDGLEKLARGVDSKGYYSAREIAKEIFDGLDSGESARGLMTGVEEWDRYAEMDLGDTMILGGDTSMGKSQVLGWMRARYIERGERVLLLSTESKRKKVGRRDLSYLTGINSRVIKTYNFDRMQLSQFGDGISRYSDWPFWVNDQIYDVDEACQFIRFMMAREGVTVVEVDHLHELTAQGITNPQERVGYCIERLAQTAQHGNGVYMQVASQLTQEASREKRVARMSDLYYSGRIRQIAQVVLMITRLAKYTNKANPGEIIFRWEKVRDGETGMDTWRWSDTNGLLLGPKSTYYSRECYGPEATQ